MALPARICVAALALGAACAAAVFAASAPGAQPIDPSRSTLVASFRQEAVTVDAPFRKFDGSIQYDPAHPADTRATLHVDMASLDIGDDDSNAEVRGTAWFDSAHFPSASFQSTSIKARDAQHFDASGDLAIKGRTRQVTVSVSVAPAAHGFSYDGSFEISRHDFGIGDPQWDSVLDDRVRVRFHLLSQ